MYIYEISEDYKPDYNHVKKYAYKLVPDSYGDFYAYCTKPVPRLKNEILDVLVCGDCNSMDIKTPYECYCGCDEIYTHEICYIRWRYVGSI